MNTQKLIELFSKNRLEGYKSKKEHEQNLSLISRISHKLGILEIIIRNRIDKIMNSKDKEWLFHLPNEIVLDDNKKLEHNTLISKQSFGFWIKVAQSYKIHSCAFSEYFLKNLNFKKYYVKNRNRVGRNPISIHQKADLLLVLLKVIRNRAFHFENLLKINADGKPRLSAKLNFNNAFVIVSIEPKNIEIFLDDILKSFDKKLLKYAKNKKVARSLALKSSKIILKSRLKNKRFKKINSRILD